MALVNFYAAAREAAGTNALKISAQSLADLKAQLGQKSSKLQTLLPTCTFLLNGESIEDLTHPLNEIDEVDVLPQFAGG